MKTTKQLICSVLSVIMLTGLIPTPAFATTFTDVPEDHWAYDYIEELVSLEILSGYGDGNFGPNDSIKRGDVAVILNRMYDFDVTPSTNTFTDLPADMYYADAILKANALGFMNGDGDGTIRPEDNIVREEYVVMLDRVFTYFDLYRYYDETGDLCNDFSSISSWAREAAGEMMKIGLINGDGDNNFNPHNNLSRAEIAKIAYVSNEAEASKDYKVETLAKADVTPLTGAVSYTAFYTQDDNDNLYYYDNTTRDVVQINMITRETEILANAETLSITYDGNTYSNMLINGLFYDSYAKSLAVYGSFEGYGGSFEHEAEPFSCIVELQTGNVVSFENVFLGYRGDSSVYHSIGDYTFYGVLFNGDYIAHRTESVYGTTYSSDHLINRETFAGTPFGADRSSFYAPYQHYNGNMYYCGINGGLYKYDYTTDETKISDMPFCGIANNRAYALMDNAIGIFTLEGTAIKAIPFDDIELADGQFIRSSNVNRVLLASSNDDIVFYDTWINAFRIITVNEDVNEISSLDFSC